MALKIFNNYFYGKPGKKDFTEADLPANRMQLFRDTLRVRWGAMCGVNLLYMIIWIPAIIWTYINIVAIMGSAEAVIEVSEAAETAAEIAAETVQAASVNPASFILPYLLILFPCIAITGPFNMGVTYVLRNWARDEHAFVLSDFGEALRKNWKQGFLFSIVSGLVPLLMGVSLIFYIGNAATSLIYYVPIALLLFAFIVWEMASMILPTMIVTYDLNFRGLLKNAIILSLAQLPRSIGIKLVQFIFPVLVYVITSVWPSSYNVLLAVTVLFYFAFYVCFNKYICTSYANFICEKYLNTRIEGARTRIGLRSEESLVVKEDPNVLM